MECVTDIQYIQYIQYAFLNREYHKHSKVSFFGLSETESLVADIGFFLRKDKSGFMYSTYRTSVITLDKYKV